MLILSFKYCPFITFTIYGAFMYTCSTRIESQPQTPQLLQVPAAIIGNTSPLTQGYWPTARPVACQLHLQLGTAGGNSQQAAPATPPATPPQFRVEAKQFCGRSLRQKQRSLCVTIANIADKALSVPVSVKPTTCRD